MDNIRNKLNKNVMGAAGEHFVTAELLRRGFVAATLYSCAKDYDILAYHPKTETNLKIQIKTSQEKSTSWKIGKKPPIFDDNTFYIFVTLVDLESPIYYIVPSKIVHERAEARHNTPKKNGLSRSDERKFIIEKNEVNDFKNNWQMLVKKN